MSRTLRWIVHETGYAEQTYCFNTAALCEAVSINLGDTGRDIEKVPDETEILRWCSSLVRKSADDDSLQLAHFTVKELLHQIGPEDNGEFAAFRIGLNHGDEDITKVCLTYLGFEEFQQVGLVSKDDIQRRLKDFPLRWYAVRWWDEHTRDSLYDDELWSLIKHFLNPSKPSNLISWTQDRIYLTDQDVQWEVKEKAQLGIAEASALHYAALLGLPEICEWLIDCGCDVNRSSHFGTPLQCALMGSDAFLAFELFLIRGYYQEIFPEQESVMETLLNAGADLSRHFKTSRGTYPPLVLSLRYFSKSLAIRLLDTGAKMDETCLDLLEQYYQLDGLHYHSYIAAILDHVKEVNVQSEHQPRMLLLRLATGKTQMPKVLENLGSRIERGQSQAIEYGRLLRTAAELGQVEAVSRFLELPEMDVQAAEKTTGRTALHYAAKRDHLDIVKLLHSHGSQLSATDHEGRTAIHDSITRSSYDCLEFFLKEGVGDIPPDKNGDSLWHLAALRDKQALETLGRYLTPIPRLSEKRNRAGLSPLMCAAQSGSAENVDWLLQAGCCNVMDATSDGTTALEFAAGGRSHEASLSIARLLLHSGYAENSDISVNRSFLIAAKSGNIGLMELLLSQGADLDAEDINGRNVVHFACDGQALDVLRFLRHKNVDWNKRGSYWKDNEWWTGVSPIHLVAQLLEPDILDYLLDEGLASDINATTDPPMTALYIATWSSNPLAISTLLSRNVDLTIKGVGGELPIEMAARFGKQAVIAAFLQHDRSREVLNDHGLKCEILAIKGGHKKAAQMFKELNMERGKISAMIPF